MGGLDVPFVARNQNCWDAQGAGSYLTIAGLKERFGKATSKSDIALYLFSVGFEMLRQWKHDDVVHCSRCKTAYQVGSKHFKPTYSCGHPIFSLNCNRADCQQVTAPDEMASAALKLLSNLSVEEL